MTENQIATHVVDCAIHIHRRIGPGLLESVYETILAHELRKRDLDVKKQVPVPIIWDNLVIDDAFRADLLVEDKVVIELKSVESVSAAHRKQIQTYVRLRDDRLGLLLNFGDHLMKDGIVRAANGLA